MAAYSALGRLLELEGPRPYWVYVNKDEPSWPHLVRLIKRAKANLRIKCGEVDKKFWEMSQIIDEMREFLNRGGNIEFCFSKFNSDGSPITSVEEAKQMLENENPNFVALVKRFPDKVKCYWFKNRPKQHYQIGDGQDLILEEFDHPVKGKRSVDILFNYHRLSSKWIARFQDALQGEDVEAVSFA